MGALLCAAVLAAAPTAAAKKKPKKAGVAVFILEKEGADRDAIKATINAMESLGVRAGMPVIAGVRLRKLLKKDPASVMTGCGANFDCIAKVGKKLKAAQVVYGRAGPGEIQFVVIGVKSKSMERRATLTVADAGSAASAVEAHFEEIFGVEIYNERVAAIQRQIHDVLWKMSRKLPHFGWTKKGLA